MTLKEELNRIKEIMGGSPADDKLLLEVTKNQILIDKVGLSPSNAEYLTRVSGSLSVWIANKIIDQQLDNVNAVHTGNIPYTKADILRHLNSRGIINIHSEDLNSIMDWIRVGLNNDVKRYMGLSFYELSSKATQWHDSLGVGDGAINYTENNPIILDFRDEKGVGYYWVDLETNDSNEECKRMGHCGRTAHGNNLYSLRETKPIGDKYTINRSHLTAAIGNDGTLYQLKGQKNSKPKEEFHELILPLFYVLGGEGEEYDYLIKGFGREYGSDRDFKITDLPNETIIELYKNRPDLFNTRALKRKLIDLKVIPQDDIDYKITLTLDPSEIGDYVNGDYVVNRRKKKMVSPAGREYENTIETTLFEKILTDPWDMFGDYYGDRDWRSALRYSVDNENEKLILDILKSYAQKYEMFDIDTFEETSTMELIEEYDDDNEIKNAINDTEIDAERDAWANHLYGALKSCLEEYGTVVELDDTGVTIVIDVEDILKQVSAEDLDDYFERCDDNIECVFNELNGDNMFDRPKFDIDDRYSPDIDDDNFNEMLRDRLTDIKH